MKTMAGKDPAALRAPVLSVCPSVFLLFFFCLSPRPLPFSFSDPPNHTALEWSGLSARKAESTVKTKTGCQRKVVQEELSFNLEKCKQTQYRWDKNEPAYERYEWRRPAYCVDGQRDKEEIWGWQEFKPAHTVRWLTSMTTSQESVEIICIAGETKVGEMVVSIEVGCICAWPCASMDDWIKCLFKHNDNGSPW